MQKESEVLLRYIGNDREINTRGGLVYIALGEAIKNGEDTQGLFRGISLDRELYRSAFLELIPFYGQMSKHAFSRLMSFAHTCGFDDESGVGLSIKRGYPLLPRNYFHTTEAYKEHIAKRADFIQTFARAKPHIFSYDELESDTELRQQCPWSWIGAVQEVNPKVTVEEIVTQLISTQSIQIFLWKISTFIHRIPNGEEYLQRIMDSVKGRIPETDYQTINQHIAHSKATKGKL